MKNTFTIEVTQTVEVELDPTKFDDAFMEEFRAGFYPFHTLGEHAEHIAQLHARGLYDLSFGSSFVEGYGESAEMGIKARVIDTDIEQVSA